MLETSHKHFDKILFRLKLFKVKVEDPPFTGDKRLRLCHQLGKPCQTSQRAVDFYD
jgi:hypothetical protein